MNEILCFIITGNNIIQPVSGGKPLTMQKLQTSNGVTTVAAALKQQQQQQVINKPQQILTQIGKSGQIIKKPGQIISRTGQVITEMKADPTTVRAAQVSGPKYFMFNSLHTLVMSMYCYVLCVNDTYKYLRSIF